MPYPIVETHAQLLAATRNRGCACRCGAHDCASRRRNHVEALNVDAPVAPRYPVVEWYAEQDA